MEGQKTSAQFTKEINRLGRITSIIALITMFLVPYGTAWYFGLQLSFMEGLRAASPLIAIFLPTAVVENLSFYPTLGAGGVYLGSITGNVTNLKIPVTVAGQQIAGVQPGSEEGDAIAIITVGVSSIVTIVILILGMFLLGSWLVPILNHPVLKPGFDQIIPALYGAITVPLVVKSPKIAITPLIIAGGFVLFLGTAGYVSYQSYILITTLILSIVVAYILFKKGIIKG